MSKELKEKILKRKANISVVGLGYVGLPLAVNFAKKGFRVFGLDKDTDRVKRLHKHESYILDVSTSEVKAVMKKGFFSASTDFDSLEESDVVLVCVPTPLKRKYTPDISYILDAIRTIREYLKKGTLVVLESTTYPGTTSEIIKPELEKSGFVAERDFYLAFSPERIDPGNKKYGLTKIPKVVGGITSVSGELTKLLYEKIINKVHLVSTAKAAEMTKLLENTFRIVNIAWVNEVAMMCDKLDIDIWEVIEAAKTKPFGFMPFYPGLGVGGHCIPDDPLYLFWKAQRHGFHSRLIKLSADINSAMPQYALERIRRILEKDKKTLNKSKVLIIGVTYKKDVKDLRKSPSLKLIEHLQKAHCHVTYFDPVIPFLDINNIHLKSVKLDRKMVSNHDCVVIATDHTKVNYRLIRRFAKNIFDIRNVYSRVEDKKISKI